MVHNIYMYIIIALYASKFKAFQAWKSFELLKSFFFKLCLKIKNWINRITHMQKCSLESTLIYWYL